MFQSTHPHGVRQSLRPSATLFHVVSIHAPTRGATSHDCYSPFSVSCFNPRTHTGCDGHTDSKPINTARFNPRTHTGCDNQTVCKETLSVCFNPRTHTGCDIDLESHQETFLVSIHAPTRGATIRRLVNGLRLCYSGFQSTHPHGVRRPEPERWLLPPWFQSTHPHGVRQIRIMQTTLYEESFNPRTHTGCDSVQSYIL